MVTLLIMRLPASLQKVKLEGTLLPVAKVFRYLSEKENVFICEKISPILKEKGLFFVGLDIIGDYLTEINVTSPTCIRELEKETPLKMSQTITR